MLPKYFHVLVVWFALVTVLPGGTYHVAITGNDALPGTLEQPFRTVQRGVDAAQSGDTVLIGTGAYDEEVKTARNGAEDAVITITGQESASIKSVTFKHSFVKVHKMRIIGPIVQYQSLVVFDLDAHHNILSDNFIDVGNLLKVYGISWRPGRTVPFDLRTGSDNVIENNTITRVRGITLVSVMGARNLVRNNRLTDSASCDFFRLFGEDNVIQGNYCYNNYSESGLGNHPDFIQTFGNNGHGSRGHIIEGNIVDKIEGGQLTQLEGNMVPQIEDWIFRNNIFMNIDLQASCSIPRVKYYNNIFYKCNTSNGGHALSFGARSYGGPNDTAKGYGGVIGVNHSHGAEVKNNVFIDCGDPLKNFGWYGFSLDTQNAAADYNHVSKAGKPVREDELQREVGDPGGWDFQKLWEPHGINGGDPGFVNVATKDFRLMANSPLIDKGFSISLVPDDIEGVARPQGAGYEIGPYELGPLESSGLFPPTGLRVNFGP